MLIHSIITTRSLFSVECIYIAGHSQYIVAHRVSSLIMTANALIDSRAFESRDSRTNELNRPAHINSTRHTSIFSSNVVNMVFILVFVSKPNMIVYNIILQSVVIASITFSIFSILSTQNQMLITRLDNIKIETNRHQQMKLKVNSIINEFKNKNNDLFNRNENIIGENDNIFAV